MTFDVSELRKLSADLASGQWKDVFPILKEAGEAIKTQLQSEAKKSRHFKLAGHISAETRAQMLGGYTEVGPVKRGAGNLANIAYFGGVHGGGGTLPDPQGALDAEADRFEKAVADKAEGIL